MNSSKIKGLPIATAVCTLLLVACAATRNGAPANSIDDIGKLLENKRFEFVPQTVIPTGSRTRQVTPDFFFRVSGDTVVSYLPFFGRSFSGQISSNRGGMDFTSTDFGYTVTQGRKDATLVTIEPRAGTDVRQLTLEIFPNGNASLQALSNNRTAISYNGFIRQRK